MLMSIATLMSTGSLCGQGGIRARLGKAIQGSKVGRSLAGGKKNLGRHERCQRNKRRAAAEAAARGEEKRKYRNAKRAEKLKLREQRREETKRFRTSHKVLLEDLKATKEQVIKLTKELEVYKPAKPVVPKRGPVTFAELKGAVNRWVDTKVLSKLELKCVDLKIFLVDRLYPENTFELFGILKCWLKLFPDCLRERNTALKNIPTLCESFLPACDKEGCCLENEAQLCGYLQRLLGKGIWGDGSFEPKRVKLPVCWLRDVPVLVAPTTQTSSSVSCVPSSSQVIAPSGVPKSVGDSSSVETLTGGGKTGGLKRGRRSIRRTHRVSKAVKLAKLAEKSEIDEDDLAENGPIGDPFLVQLSEFPRSSGEVEKKGSNLGRAERRKSRHQSLFWRLGVDVVVILESLPAKVADRTVIVRQPNSLSLRRRTRGDRAVDFKRAAFKKRDPKGFRVMKNAGLIESKAYLKKRRSERDARGSVG